MKRFLRKTLASSSIFALTFSSLLVLIAVPAQAASISSVSDTMSRVKISESATHTLAVTFPGSGVWDAGEQVVFDYSTAGFALDDSTPTCSLGTGSCHAIVASATDSLTIECDATTCSGALTLGTFTGTNPGTAGTKSISVSTTGGDGDGNVSGSFSIGIADDDQVTVTATVAEEMTFDIDVGTSTAVTDSDAPYTVALGTLSTGSVSTSGDGTINIIALEVSTNASGGAVVQVKNANGSSGLTSSSAPTDTIDVFTGTLAAGTEGYNICVNKVGTTSGTLQSENFHTGSTLSATGTTATSTTCTSSVHQMPTALSTTFTDILSSNGAALSAAQGEVYVKAAISATTAAHDDYTDTLTFRATATF